MPNPKNTLIKQHQSLGMTDIAIEDNRDAAQYWGLMLGAGTGCYLGWRYYHSYASVALWSLLGMITGEVTALILSALVFEPSQRASISKSPSPPAQQIPPEPAIEPQPSATQPSPATPRATL